MSTGTSLIVLVVLLIAWFCSVIWLQRYVVYSADGAQVDFELGDAGFAGVVATGILLVGYVFNWIL